MSQILKLLSFPLLKKERNVLLQGHFLYSSEGSLDSARKNHIIELQGTEWQGRTGQQKGICNMRLLLKTLFGIYSY